MRSIYDPHWPHVCSSFINPKVDYDDDEADEERQYDQTYDHPFPLQDSLVVDVNTPLPESSPDD